MLTRTNKRSLVASARVLAVISVALVQACGGDAVSGADSAPPGSVERDAARPTMRGDDAGSSGANHGLDAQATLDGDSGGPGADAGFGDPGVPETPYGPKAEADLFVGAEKLGYIFFTAIAPNQTDLAHFYAKPEPAASVGVRDYYLSLVLDRAAWHQGEYRVARGGRVRFELANGNSYAGDAAGIDVNFNITNATATATGYILRGEAELTVPANKAGGEPLTVRMNINPL